MKVLHGIKEHVEKLIKGEPSDYEGDRGLKLLEIDINQALEIHGQTLDELESANVEIVNRQMAYEARVWKFVCDEYLEEHVSIHLVNTAKLKIKPMYSGFTKEAVIRTMKQIYKELTEGL